MEFLYNVEKIDIEESTVSQQDAEKYGFPLVLKELKGIELYGENCVISYKDKRFADQYAGSGLSKNGKSGEKIIISFSSVQYPHINCVLRVEQIDYYYCEYYNANVRRRALGKPELTFDNLMLSIGQSEDKNFFLDIASECFGVSAEKIVIQNLSYV